MSLSKIIFVLATTLAGCAAATEPGSGVSSGAANPPAQIGATQPSSVIELKYDETANHEDLSFRWLTLNDSRCPTGITCVWAGQMIATIEVVHAAQEKLEVQLLRRAGREPEVLNAFGYELRLKEVFPHPKKNITPDRRDYVMRFDISLAKQ